MFCDNLSLLTITDFHTFSWLRVTCLLKATIWHNFLVFYCEKMNYFLSVWPPAGGSDVSERPHIQEWMDSINWSMWYFLVL